MGEKLKIFLGSSSEALNIMWALERELSDRGFDTVPWKGSFDLARNTLDEIWDLAKKVDFAVFVMASDSILEERGRQTWAPRDNVVYEAGLFAGVLSPTRVFLVVESGLNIKIPSDYSGIGYTSCKESDEGSIRHAAIEIHKAIDRSENEAIKDNLIRRIEGLWIDAVVNRDEMSVVSTFELKRKGSTLDVLNGRAWGPDGEPRSKFWSTSSKFIPETQTLIYSWEGKHPRERVVSEHFGVGTLVFNPDDPNHATGWFSSSPKLALEKTHLMQRECKKLNEPDSSDLRSDNRNTRQEAVKRLLHWREEIR